MNVAELRKNGWRVRVSHYRFYETDWNFHELLHRSELDEFTNPTPEPRGGLTEVEVLSPDGKTSIGVARCALEDNYCKKFGVIKALGRAIGQLNKEEEGGDLS